MSMTTKARTAIIAAAATGALAVAALSGSAMANAADGTPSPSASQSTTSTPDKQHTPEEVLTGDAATQVKAAVDAKYPGATIDRMEKDSDGQSVYEAHITKADGTRVTVMLDANYAITGENADNHGGRGGHHGRGGHDANGTSNGATTATGSTNTSAA